MPKRNQKKYKISDEKSVKQQKLSKDESETSSSEAKDLLPEIAQPRRTTRKRKNTDLKSRYLQSPEEVKKGFKSPQKTKKTIVEILLEKGIRLAPKDIEGEKTKVIDGGRIGQSSKTGGSHIFPRASINRLFKRILQNLWQEHRIKKISDINYFHNKVFNFLNRYFDEDGMSKFNLLFNELKSFKKDDQKDFDDINQSSKEIKGSLNNISSLFEQFVKDNPQLLEQANFQKILVESMKAQNASKSMQTAVSNLSGSKEKLRKELGYLVTSACYTTESMHGLVFKRDAKHDYIAEANGVSKNREELIKINKKFLEDKIKAEKKSAKAVKYEYSPRLMTNKIVAAISGMLDFSAFDIFKDNSKFDEKLFFNYTGFSLLALEKEFEVIEYILCDKRKGNTSRSDHFIKELLSVLVPQSGMLEFLLTPEKLNKDQKFFCYKQKLLYDQYCMSTDDIEYKKLKSEYLNLKIPELTENQKKILLESFKKHCQYSLGEGITLKDKLQVVAKIKGNMFPSQESGTDYSSSYSTSSSSSSSSSEASDYFSVAEVAQNLEFEEIAVNLSDKENKTPNEEEQKKPEPDNFVDSPQKKKIKLSKESEPNSAMKPSDQEKITPSRSEKKEPELQ